MGHLGQRWRELWHKLLRRLGLEQDADGSTTWVPIRPLAPRHKPKILAHLLQLSEQDRYLRFGYAANDEQIARYVEQINFERDEVFGIFNRRLELAAMAHLAYSVDPKWSTCAEFGVSVTAHYRGRKLGSRLFDRAVYQARNQGVHMLFIHALSENAAMLRIARNAGARVEREGSESEAYLSLPQATLDTHLTAMVEDQIAEVDYRIKQQARQFREWLATAQEVRQGVREAKRHGGR